MYKKTGKKSLLSFILGFVLMLSLLSSTVFAGTVQETDSSQISRLSGNDRYQTAVAIAQNGWEKSKYVILARGDDFPDALSAGPLAKKYDAPILLTQPNSISDEVVNEIISLQAENVIIVGGEGAISKAVADELRALKIIDKQLIVDRIGGSDRFETAVGVANEMGEVENIAVTTGYNYPDALSIAPIASSKGMPILLADKEGLSDSVKNYIESKKSSINTTYIVGGQGVVSPDVEQYVKNPVRLAGADRYETNVAVMAQFVNEIDFEDLYMAVGEGTANNEFADALAGAALAAKTTSPVILMYNTIPVNTAAFLALASSENAKVTALGGTAVVPENAADTLVRIIKMPIIGTDLGSTAERGTEKNFQVGTMAKDSKGEMVRVKITLTKGSDIAAVAYKEVSDGKYYDLSFDSNGVAWYGPEAGFPMADITSDFKAAFNKVGTLEYKLEVVKVSDNSVLTSFSGSVTVTAPSMAGDAARAYVEPTNFNTNLSNDYVGYNVGWKLTDKLNLSDIAKMEISLLDDKDNVLVTNVSTDKIQELTGAVEFSTAFNVAKSIDYKDDYWTLGGWANGTKQPSKAQIKITNKNGDTYTVVNDSLAVVAGDEDVAKYLDSYVPMALNGEEAKQYVVTENFNTHFNAANSLDYVGYNAGWKLTDKIKLSDVAKMDVSLLDSNDAVLVTNTSTDKILTLNTDEFSTPFNINFHINYTDEYWTFGKWNGKTQQPAKVQIKITTKYGDTFTVVNDNLALVQGDEPVAGYLGY